MQGKRGEIKLYKYDFSDNEFSISFGSDSEDYLNFNTKAFRIFKNQCVGHPNMTIFKDRDIRDKRYEKGKQILINAGYEVIEE